MPGLRPDIDPDGLLEYSVVYTDRALNHMSETFQTVMNDISATLKKVYNAKGIAIVPGSGTYGMEAVARQFANDKKCLVIRNGWFSFRWSQIFEMGQLPSHTMVLKAKQTEAGTQAPFAPPSIEHVVETIQVEKPHVVFAPHVETSAGMILPDEYLKKVGTAVHQHGGLFVLDCIASGTIWVDMEACGVDVLISAPQKGWSGTPFGAFVMMSQAALDALEETESNSFSCDLKKWYQIMQAYEKGGHAYHATMPTDAITSFRNVMKEAEQYGFDRLKAEQQELGHKVRNLLESRGFPSVAADGFKAPGVVVSYTDDKGVHNGQKFKEAGVQIAAGVPLRCDEPEEFQTFRLGLFGLDKLKDVDGAVARLAQALDEMGV